MIYFFIKISIYLVGLYYIYIRLDETNYNINWVVLDLTNIGFERYINKINELIIKTI